jgi:hypothetical protein
MKRDHIMIVKAVGSEETACCKPSRQRRAGDRESAIGSGFVNSLDA